jgi:TctA family transporter
MGVIDNLLLGLGVALTLTNLFYCFAGVFMGTLIGVIPGIGALAAISMLFPITFHLDPTAALIMLAGIWYGTAYGGSTASILLNIPGTTSSAVTCLDGYPMSRQGRGGVALLMTTVASFIGGSIGVVLLMLFAPIIADYALEFGSADYFSLMLLGLVAASTITDSSAVKGLAMVTLGVGFGLVGTDIYSGTQRFTFEVIELGDGISLVALAMGVFGVAEVISSIGKVDATTIDPESVKFKAMRPTRTDLRRSWMPIARGSTLGSFFGTLPGTGPAIASFMSYALEKQVSSRPEEFGKGAIEGVVGPESANNAADQTAFIPTLSLGIPGSPTMALMLGALMIHGINPGPRLLTEQPEMFWGLIMSFWIGNLFLLILNIPLIGIWVRLLQVPYHMMFPAVLAFIAIGSYSVHNSVLDVWMVVAFGAFGVGMRLLKLPAAPLLLGFVLGPMMEEHFRRAMLLSRGDFATFVERPISGIVLGITVIFLIYAVYSAFQVSKPKRAKAEPA